MSSSAVAPMVDSSTQPPSKIGSEFYRQASDSPPPANKAVPLQRFQQLEQEIRLHAANPQPYRELSSIYLESGRTADALRVLASAAANCPEAEDLQFELEEVKLRIAEELAANAKKQAARYSTAANLQDESRSLTELQALKINIGLARYRRRQDPRWQLLAAGGLYEQGNYDQAITALKIVRDYPAARSAAHYLLGQCLRAKAQVLEALSAYRTAALRRVPPPPTDVRTGALKAAAELAAEHSLFASAVRYVELLLSDPQASGLSDAEVRQLERQLANYKRRALEQNVAPETNPPESP